MPSLGDVFPDFSADTTIGPIRFHEWLGNSLHKTLLTYYSLNSLEELRVFLARWLNGQQRTVDHVALRRFRFPAFSLWAIFFSHPADYTPVCTTELGHVASIIPEFQKRGIKVIAISCNSVNDHKGWIKDIQDYFKLSDAWPYPIIADPCRELTVKLGMLDPAEKDKSGLPVTGRAAFVIGPDKRLRLSLLYPATTGRNFDEILRVIDSLKLTAENKVATPANWKQGERCMVLPTVKPGDCPVLFPKGVDTVALPSGKSYMRLTPQPD